MKAIVLKKYGKSEEAFLIEERATPEIPDGHVLIDSEGFGLNYADVMARKGFYQDAPPIPCILGYEAVGRIVECGKDADESLIGKRVCAFTRFGAYGQMVTTDQKAVFPIDDDVELGEALALATQYGTAYYCAYHSVNLIEGDKVMIHAAAGGVGSALVQMAKARKCEVLAMAGSDEKLDFLKNLGADHVFNYRKQDYKSWATNIAGEQGLDVVFNSVAGDTFKKDMSLLGSGGRLVVYGAAQRSSMGKGLFAAPKLLWKMGLIIPIKLMMNSQSIIGVNMLKIGDDRPNQLTACLNGVMRLHKSGVVRPVLDKEFNYTEIAEAHSRLEFRKSIGKIAVRW